MIRTVLVFSLILMSGTATAAEPAGTTGLLAVPANRIVGLWQMRVSVAPCTGGPSRNFIAYNTFHGGGTMSDTNAAPPTTRGPAQGVWRYMGQGLYKARFQFFRYLPDGSYDGVSDIRLDMSLAASASQLTQDVRGYNLNPDGSLRVELCGTAVGERVGVE